MSQNEPLSITEHYELFLGWGGGLRQIGLSDLINVTLIHIRSVPEQTIWDTALFDSYLSF